MSKTISCIIVEDEPMARKLLEQYVERLPYLELSASLSSPLAALEYLRNHQPDLLFLDVQMPEITGIGLLKILENKPFIILTTAYSEYAIEGYSLDVTDYLLKPITFERFLAAVEKVHRRIQETSAQPTEVQGGVTIPAAEAEDYFFVKDGTVSVRIRFSDILYVEGMKDYVRIHTPERKVTTLYSLKHLLEVLPEGHFARIHHSYIVALDRLDEVHRDQVRINGAMLPVSDTYRRAFRELVDEKHLK